MSSDGFHRQKPTHCLRFAEVLVQLSVMFIMYSFPVSSLNDMFVIFRTKGMPENSSGSVTFIDMFAT